MHEISVAQSMMDVVAESARQRNIRQVRRINLIIGEWSAISPEALTTCFEMVAQESGELFAGAQLVIRQALATGECLTCGERFPADITGLSCPDCGGAARLIAGTELAVDSYEGD